MVDEMSSSAWVLMEDDCSSSGDCWGPPPAFHIPPPPIPAELSCEEFDMSCPSQLNVADAEFKRIGTFPSVTVIICCTLLSTVILLVIAVIVWRKRRKGVTQTKDFDHHHHHGPPMMNGNGLLYEDLSHARPRPPIAPPTMEMLDVNHHHSMETNGMIGNPKLDFSYFLNPPPIYEELPEIDTGHSDRNNGPSEDEFAEDELSVIDVPINQCHPGLGMGMNLGYDGGGGCGGGNEPNNPLSRYQQQHTAVNRGTKPRAQSLNRKRNSARNTGSSAGGGGGGSGDARGGGAGGGFKSQRSLDRRTRQAIANKYTGTTPRPLIPPNPNNYRATMGGSGMLILSDQNGMTMKIPPHLVAVLTESALQNSAVRPYEVIQSPGGIPPNSINPSQMNAIYPSSRSSGSSYGDGSNSSGSARINPNGTSAESSSFDSGLGQHSIASFVNSPAYEPSGYPTFDYSTGQGEMPQNHYQSIHQQHGQHGQHPSFRRLRMTTADRDHPLNHNHEYSNHFLT